MRPISGSIEIENEYEPKEIEEKTEEETASDAAIENGTPRRKVSTRGKFLLLCGALLTALAVGVPLTAWQQSEEKEAVSVNNLRQIGQGLLLYTQDWDDRPMPPVLHLTDNSWRTWPETLLPYLASRAPLDNPLNPLQKHTLHPKDGYKISAGYALNRRFWNTFGTGPYSLDDLELPYRTALFVEAGPMRPDPLHAPSAANRPVPLGILDYGDIGDRFNALSPYPSAHHGKIALVAADGHAELVTVAHYNATDGLHDALYGRIGGTLYNWNGGYPNGETDYAPHE